MPPATRQAMGQLRGRLRERSKLEHGTLDRSQTVGEPSGRIGHREQIVGFRALVVGDALESLVEFARKLTSAGQSGRDADSRSAANGKRPIARLVHQDDDRRSYGSTQRLPHLHAAPSYGVLACGTTRDARGSTAEPDPPWLVPQPARATFRFRADASMSANVADALARDEHWV